MSNFQQDPWRPGAAALTGSAAPVQEDPPKLPEPTPVETPPEPVATAPKGETLPDDKQALQDELEKALAEMRGKE